MEARWSMAVVYCRGCGARLGEKERDDPDLVETGLGTWCPSCSTAGLKSLPPEQQKILLDTSVDQKPAKPKESRRKVPGRTTRRRLPRRRRSSSGALVALLIGGAALLVILLALALSG